MYPRGSIEAEVWLPPLDGTSTCLFTFFLVPGWYSTVDGDVSFERKPSTLSLPLLRVGAGCQFRSCGLK